MNAENVNTLELKTLHLELARRLRCELDACWVCETWGGGLCAGTIRRSEFGYVAVVGYGADIGEAYKDLRAKLRKL